MLLQRTGIAAALIAGAAAVGVFTPAQRAEAVNVTIGGVSVTVSVTVGIGRFSVTIDPDSIAEFNTDWWYDSNEVSFLGISNIDPYVITSYDSSVPGLIQDVHGLATMPVPGPADMFTVHFAWLNVVDDPDDADDFVLLPNDWDGNLDDDYFDISSDGRDVVRTDDFFQKNHVDFRIPTPGSVVLAGLGGLAILRRRRAS